MKNPLTLFLKESSVVIVVVSMSRIEMVKNTRESNTMFAATGADEYEWTPASMHIEVGPICAPFIANGNAIAHARVPSQRMLKTATTHLSIIHTAHTRRRNKKVVAGIASA